MHKKEYNTGGTRRRTKEKSEGSRNSDKRMRCD
jgi:hypothetical protein